ncbi:very short patch repair endonuclease [Hyunsoonleella sp. SJ7]|uniref:Very short patch repair endonuclease n=1 Tax=Hyunsoonleella aquatilis TaxID=2762758 RepID=A0A923KGG2_9FLAO|nr:very short patch repair endonuclease [Hyunsoonleella aquatilis]MBC3758226.1 very short patch repair endonuclease [Hyunsoonleella aquatilis]
MSSNYEDSKIKVPRFNEESGFYTTKKRSKMMSKIRGKNTKPELLFRKALWKKGVRYRVDSKTLPGKPDVSIKKYRLAIFIDGEYWHGYNWNERKPKLKTNRGFWIPKIERNMQRDKEVNRQLEDLGFTVFRFWSKEVTNDLERCINDVLKYLDIGDITIQ